ncbi:bifunctional enzyme IspD/IspF [Capsulimonas corticalis]|uniref:Bifunctional enzyme IspD/IspF n=1 Tax=Capsulimonas corticalis TaxID=2219043 RepID=A0A402CQK6_9BACT|nr:2-C-methyl-D-erythritol 4-phosphate cytidylyltransferase [Capsulimonas corticalis]BDI32674.1 bifunctional enzyme IspD/IspF [Capsulimonas corticalis]
MTKMHAVIPAAGLGARFSTNGNKVFASLSGRPMLEMTVDAFRRRSEFASIVVVTGEDDLSRCREIVKAIAPEAHVVRGGATRQESVRLGLTALDGADDDIVFVHDGARPLVSDAIIDRCIEGQRRNGNAVAAIPVVDTLKLAAPDQTVERNIDRERLWAVQTPQVFPLGLLREAHASAWKANFLGTDEASLVERLGIPVHLVEGSSTNLKITRAEDAAVAEALLRPARSGAQMRVGFGYDIHRLEFGRRLVLGGVEIPTTDGRGLDGHSDADVLLHAICDSLLGAAGLPDIGHLFPNTDPAYAGADSMTLLAEVFRRVRELGWRVQNVDATIVAEAPKIGPYTAQMRNNIVQLLEIEPSCLGIKATTNEGLGSLGQGLGIAAQAVACLCQGD